MKTGVELILVLATLQCWCSLATLLQWCRLATLHWRPSRHAGCGEGSTKISNKINDEQTTSFELNIHALS